jgi:glycosyltransferase involved in cell wall biosynthesis
VTVHAEAARLRETLAALEQPSRWARDLLLLGDGPDRDVAQMLASLPDIRQSSTSSPAGPPACFNRLARESDDEVVVLLESGAVPTPEALDLLVDVLVRDRRIGLAGPSTNRSWNEQEAFAGAPGGDAILATGREATGRYGSTVRTLEPLYSLADFCLAVRRDVIQTIGAVDEGYGLGPCWELEYNARAARAGFRGAWVRGAYVWRAPFTARRRIEEARRFDASRRRYQDSVCGLRLRRLRDDHEPHCRGDECEHFAPPGLITIHRPLRSRPAAPRTSAAPKAPGNPLPLVSCVMPTRGRPDFVRQAVSLFERQDYPNRELLIVGEPRDGLDRLVPTSERIRHIQSPGGESIGAKRNRACSAAPGTYLAHWDDDDWYGTGRLSAQMAPLIAGRADITGLSTPVFFDLQSWRFWTVTPALHKQLFRGDVHGGTLVFAKNVWHRLARYPDTSLAEDAALLMRATASGARLERVDGQGLFVYLRHGGNAWRFPTGEFLDRGGWQTASEPALPAEDRAFYARRCSGPAVASRRDDGPLVSCIMPTHNRRRWVQQSIAYFHRQDYVRRELLILDDGDDDLARVVPDDPMIRYVRLEDRLVLGEKRNRACELAEGEIIAHWDDDDWQAPHRLSYQVNHLLQHGADICGPGSLLYFEPAGPRAWRYECPRGLGRWIAGNAMCYRKDLWSEHRFDPVAIGEDTRFILRLGGGSPLVLSDDRFLVALIHDTNTSPKATSGAYWRARPLDDVRELLGDDLPFYVDSGAVPAGA